MDKVIRAGIYIRVSTEEQAKHGYSIDSQRCRLTDWCNDHHYQIVDVYADEGKSARTKLANRKELNRLLDDVVNDKIDRIVIWRLDRWFRNVADYYRIQDILDKNNVDWECSDEDFNTSTSNGRLYLNIKLSIAQNESDQTSDRIKFNFENMVKNKRPITSALPIGYKIEGEKQNKRVVKDPELEQMAIDMFKVYEDTLSLKATTQYLHDNYPLRPIRYECVKKFLKNPLYHGEYRGVLDYCEPYITKEKQDSLIEIIMKNHKKNNRSQHVFLFRGLIRCYDCKTRMSGSYVYRKRASGEKVYYGTYKCCRHWLDCMCDNNHTINENILENWLLDNLKTKLNDHIVKIESIEESYKVKKKTLKIEDLNSKLERINDLYIDGRISKEKYYNEYRIVQEKIKSISVETTTNKKDLKKYKKLIDSSDALDIYKKLSDENKRIFWNEIIDSIEQDGEKNFKVFFK